MKIRIPLDGCCIETAAKRLRRNLEAALLDDAPDQASLGARLELLNRFLTTQDFPRLRALHPELSGETDIFVVLMLSIEGSMKLETDSGADLLDKQSRHPL